MEEQRCTMYFGYTTPGSQQGLDQMRLEGRGEVLFLANSHWQGNEVECRREGDLRQPAWCHVTCSVTTLI